MDKDSRSTKKNGTIYYIKRFLSTFLYTGAYHQIHLANHLLKEGKPIGEQQMMGVPKGHNASINYSQFCQREKQGSNSLMKRLITMQGKLWIAYILLNFITHSLKYCTTYTLKLTINKAESGMSFPVALILILIFVVCYAAVDIGFLHLFHYIDIGKYKIKSSLVFRLHRAAD